MSTEDPNAPASDNPEGSPQLRESLTKRLQRIGTEPAPNPKGKGIVLALLGLVLIGAVVEMFMGKGAASNAIDRARSENPAGATATGPVQPEAPEGTEPDAPAVPPTAFSEIEIPADMPEEYGRQLAGDLSALGGSYLGTQLPRTAVLSAVRALPARLARAPAGHEEAAYGLALERAAEMVERGFERSAALELTLDLMPDVPAGAQSILDRIMLAARSRGLADPQAANAALMLLDALPNTGGAVTLALIEEVVVDPTRPLITRLLAAKALEGHEVNPNVLRLAEDEDTHRLLRAALRRNEGG